MVNECGHRFDPTLSAAKMRNFWRVKMKSRLGGATFRKPLMASDSSFVLNQSPVVNGFINRCVYVFLKLESEDISPIYDE